MAITLTPYGELSQEGTLADDRYDYFTIENNGELFPSPSIGNQEKNPNLLNIDEYTFRVFSNVDNAAIYVDGEEQNITTPGLIKFKKSDLFKNDVTRTITVRKNGYRTEERYQIFITSLISTPLEEITLVQDENGFVNLRDIDIKIRYYNGDQLIEFNGFNSVITPLGFTLERQEDPRLGERRIATTLVGDDGSVVLERVNDGQIFPLSSKKNTRRDETGTRYILRSVDTTSYRLGGVRITVAGKTETLFAGDGESLTTEITLNNDTQLDAISQRLVIKENIQPRLRIDGGSVKTLNKNGNTGVPVVIEKNSVVTAITVIIGDDIYEYTDLGSSSKVAITLPKNAFDRLGSYNVKLFPYSISQLESFTEN